MGKVRWANRQGAENLSRQILSAAEQGNAAAVRTLVPQADPTDERWLTFWEMPLLLACKAGHTDVLQALLECGVSVDSYDMYGRPALLSVASEGHLGAVRMLLAAGADVNIQDVQFGRHDALQLAVKEKHLDVVQALLAAGADLHTRDSKLATALHYAARRADVPMMEALVAAGADCNAIDRKRRSVLAWAAKTGKAAAVQKLLELGAPVDAPAITAAADSARSKPLEVLLRAAGAGLPSIPGVGAALASAASKGRYENVAALLRAGIPVNEKDIVGKTALMCAADSASDQALDIVQALLDAGASVNESDNQGKTALMFAAVNRSPFYGTLGMVKALLQSGADVSAADNEGVTALLGAVKAGKMGAADLIISSGAADLTLADKWGFTPAFLAALDGHSLGVDWQALGVDSTTSAARQRFFEAAFWGNVHNMLAVAAAPPPGGLDINTLGSEGVHCTHLVAARVPMRQYWPWVLAAVDRLRQLRAAGADVAAASQARPTPLDCLLFKNDLEWLNYPDQATGVEEFARELAAAGCPVDTGLPARAGDGSLQPSTLETWVARLAHDGWPSKRKVAGRALAVSRALLECAAAQGSTGRPELLAAAKAVGSPKLVAAVQEVLPVISSLATPLPPSPPKGGNKRRSGKKATTPRAAASITHTLVAKPTPTTLPMPRLVWLKGARNRVGMRHGKVTHPSKPNVIRMAF